MDNNHHDNPYREDAGKGGENNSGRPAEAPSLVKGFPLGIQKLLFGASIDDGFKKTLLEDPFKASGELDVRLTDTEKAVLSAIPRQQLCHTIEKMSTANMPRRQFLFKSAVTLAAVVSLAFGGSPDLAHALEQQDPEATPSPKPSNKNKENRVLTRGISIDYPQFDNMPIIDEAIQYYPGQLIMAIFIRRKKQGESPLKEETDSLLFIDHMFEDPSIRKTVMLYQMKPAKGYELIDPAFYGIKKFPTIVFISTNDEVFGRIERPNDKQELLKAIEAAGEAFMKKTNDTNP